MSCEISQLNADYTFKRDEHEFALCDSLDVKASIILVILVFLAEQSDKFFQAGVVGCARMLQYVSVSALIIGGICAVLELWPRDYGTEGTPQKYDDWLAKLREHYASSANADELVLEQVVLGRAKRAKERAEANIATNKLKTRFLYASFLFIVVSLTANLLTLATRLF
jgi:hypothetical protein